MKTLLRLRRCLPQGLCRQSLGLVIVGLNTSKSNVLSRNFGQIARKEVEENVEEVEIEQRSLPADFDPATFDLTA